MGELLINSASCSIIANGFGCRYQSCDQIRGRNSVCYRCFNGGLAVNAYISTVSMPDHQFVWFGQKKMSRTYLSSESNRIDDNGVNVSRMVASVESVMVCEDDNDDDENSSMQKGKQETGLDSMGQNFPPWGNLVVDQSFNFEPRIVAQPSTSSNRKDTFDDCRVHLLEERNEEELSRRILTLSRSNKVRSALEYFRSMMLSGLQPSAHACNSLLSCLLRKELLDDALRTFEFMKKNGIVTGHTYSLILKAVADNRGLDPAFDMFAELEVDSEQRKGFDIIVYNTAISICGRMDNWVETERLWRRIQENGYIGTRITYSLLVSIFVRCNQNELALDAYNEMIQIGLEPRIDTMRAMISACTKEEKWDLALSIFQKMLNDGLKPNPVDCNALINALGKAGEVKLAFKIYDIMKSLGHTPDAFTWNSLLGALYRANQYADALHLFQRIREKSSLVNVHLYNTALMSCQKLGSWDRALQLLWQMEASGLLVSTTTYNLVIGACETARKPKVALQVYDHMIHQKCVPDTFTHLSVIRTCIWGSLWTEVEEILERIPPDVSLYNAAIHGMCLRGKVELAKKLYMRMKKNGLKADLKTRALMLQNLQNDQLKVKRLSHQHRR